MAALMYGGSCATTIPGFEDLDFLPRIPVQAKCRMGLGFMGASCDSDSPVGCCDATSVASIHYGRPEVDGYAELCNSAIPLHSSCTPWIKLHVPPASWQHLSRFTGWGSCGVHYRYCGSLLRSEKVKAPKGRAILRPRRANAG